MEGKPSEAIKALAEHYQKTFELTYDLWVQRNRLFVTLLVVMAVGVLLGSDIQGLVSESQIEGARTLFVFWLAGTLGLDQVATENLQSSFPFDLMQTVLLAAIFYLMFNLYHRTASVLRNYQYLGAIEPEIRAHLGLDSASVSFTREGRAYWESRGTRGWKAFINLPLAFSKFVYIVLLAGLLTFFVINQLSGDVRASMLGTRLLDIGLIALTGFYYLAYTLISLGLDSPAERGERVRGGKG